MVVMVHLPLIQLVVEVELELLVEMETLLFLMEIQEVEMVEQV
jgi:hypothetical protein